MWYVYILECRDGTYYTGMTVDMPRRLEEHNASPLGARYTRSRRPVNLAYVIKKKNRSSAAKEELRIKRLTKQQKRKLINSASNNQQSSL